MAEKKLFKVVFLNNGKVYELFAHGVTTSGLWGFIEVSELVFETTEGLVVDPTEEKMRARQRLAPADPERVARRGSGKTRPVPDP